MAKTLVTILFCIIMANLAQAQVEQGDREINFIGFYATTVGTDYRVGYGNIQVTYGYFITRNLQIGVGPAVSFFEGGGETETNISGSAFLNYNFVTESKTVPYLTGQWYQWDFDPEEGDFMDYSYVNVGGGVKNFFTEYLALNTSVTYGFSLAEDAEGGMVLVMSGLSFIF